MTDTIRIDKDQLARLHKTIIVTGWVVFLSNNNPDPEFRNQKFIDFRDRVQNILQYWEEEEKP